MARRALSEVPVKPVPSWLLMSFRRQRSPTDRHMYMTANNVCHVNKYVPLWVFEHVTCNCSKTSPKTNMFRSFFRCVSPSGLSLDFDQLLLKYNPTALRAATSDVLPPRRKKLGARAVARFGVVGIATSSVITQGACAA